MSQELPAYGTRPAYGTAPGGPPAAPDLPQVPGHHAHLRSATVSTSTSARPVAASSWTSGKPRVADPASRRSWPHRRSSRLLRRRSSTCSSKYAQQPPPGYYGPGWGSHGGQHYRKGGFFAAVLPLVRLRATSLEPAAGQTGAQRLETVESDRGVATGVGPGGEQPYLITLGQSERQLHPKNPLVQHADAAAGRPGQHHRPGRPAVGRGDDAIADRLVQGLHQPAEHSRVQVDPAHAVPPHHGQHGDRQDAGITGDAPARLDHGARAACAEGVREGLLDRLAVAGEGRLPALVPGWEPPPRSSSHGTDALAQGVEHGRRRGDRRRPGLRIGVAASRRGTPPRRIQAPPGPPPAGRRRSHGCCSRTCSTTTSQSPRPWWTAAPARRVFGAASATLAVSSIESTTNRRTPGVWAVVTSARRLTGLEQRRSPGRAPAPRA